MNPVIFLIFFTDGASVSCPRVDRSPAIDGILEECWSKADSVREFKAFRPYYASEPSESTTAYLMHDDENLYIAFRCQIKGRGPDIRLTMRDGGTGDEVKVMLDTYGTGITGYRFAVSAAGTQSDARVTDDARSMDFSWDGVWRRGVCLTDSSFTVEIAIPFKAIRYGPGPWGVCFIRATPSRSETAMWPLMPQNTDLRMSLLARVDIEPPRHRGLHLELYPVALAGNSFVSSEDYSWENQGFDIRYQREGFYSEAGLDMTWSPSPSTSLQATLNPDFAQIEADPFQLNLTKYELWLAEKRPFFIEGADIFDSPIKVFYSRRIGPGLSTGAKLSSSGSRFEYGALLARTEPYTEMISGDTLDYPSGLYYVGKAKIRIFSNSNTGLMVSGAERETTYNRAGCLGLALRGASWAFKNGLAFSDRDGKTGKAFTSTFNLSGKTLYAGAELNWSEESFDVSEIGFYPYSGSKNLNLYAGPVFYPERGPFSEIRLAGSGGLGKEKGEDTLSWGMGPVGEISLRGGQGLGFQCIWNKSYEQGRVFWAWNPSIDFHTDWQKPVYLWAMVWRSYDYNYMRGYFAPQLGAELAIRYTIRSGLAVSANVNIWAEKRPDNSLEAITVSPRPKLSWLPKSGMNISIYAEPAFTDGDIERVVGGALFSWEFAPKSWLYLVYNHEAEDDGTGRMIATGSAFQMKVKYLLVI
ncbi:MAG: DUF5916 domain-containing protein [candidate division WOR-3 bacterium]